MAEQVNPWDRQEGEPSDWYERFDCYRRLGPSRSIRAAHRATMSNEKQMSGTWSEQSRAWRWEERAAAWDDSQRAGREADYERAMEAARKRNLDMAAKARKIALAKLAKLERDAVELTASEVVKLAEFAVQLETESLAAPVLADLRKRLDRLAGIGGDKGKAEGNGDGA